MRALVALAVGVALATLATPALAKPQKVKGIVPQAGERYDFLSVFTGPCTPANALPAPKRGDQTATSTWTETLFHRGDPDKPWGIVAPQPNQSSEPFPQPGNPRGACRADRGRSVFGRDTVQTNKLGLHTMTSYRITDTSYVCSAGTSEEDIAPGANWCFVDGPSSAEVVREVEFEVYWHCLYEVLQADPGSQISHRSGKKRGVMAMKAGGVVLGGDAFIIPFGGTATLRSGGVEMRLTGGFYETKKDNDCELGALPEGDRVLKAQPAPVPPKVKDGKISVMLDDVKSFIVDTPDAVIRGLTGTQRRAADDAPDGFTVTRDKDKRTTRVCVKHGRVRVDPRARGRRTSTIAQGRCAVVGPG
jgi:hypothetical protein